MKYVLITPAHNEEKYIRYTLDSVVKQTILPEKWIIVNDGSTDRTKTIVEKYIKKYPWIKLINNDTYNEKRAVGSKVVRAFYAGYNSIKKHDYDFIVKLDADLTLPNDYFEKIDRCFVENPKVGLCSGYCAIIENGFLIREKSAAYHTRGAIKSYRKECFKGIGGLKSVMGWDGVDEMTSMYYGWKTKVLNKLKVIHHRPTGNAGNNILTTFIIGKALYSTHGYNVFLLLLRAFKIGLTRKPYIITTLTTIVGYFFSKFKREKKVLSPEIEKYIRKFQYKRILKTVRQWIKL